MMLQKKMPFSNRGQTIVELTFVIPMLIALGFGVVEVTNRINSFLVLTHLTREAANITSRESGVKGTSQWATDINSDLSAVINQSSPVINPNGTGPTGPSQFKVIYSMIEWNTAPGACGGGKMANGTADNYRIRRSNTGWAGNVTWQYGSLSQASKIGSDGDCAYLALPEVKNLSTQGLKLHVIEVFYDYTPSKLTPADAFISALATGLFYRRSVFIDVVG